MNLNKLQYFMSVYEEGSITAAAKKHFVSQVAMSQQIMSLEEELGIKLFLREKNRLYQTSASHYFYEEIRKILKSYDKLVVDIRNYANDNKKLLRIGVNYYSLYEWIKNYTRQFEKLFQDVSITFEFYPSNELIIQLDKGFLDIIIIWDEYVKNLGFYSQPAFQSRSAVLVPCKSPLSHRESLSFDDLKQEKVVILIEELPYYKRTGHLNSLLNDFYRYTPLQKSDVVVSGNVNEALLLSSEENRVIITYEDKLYKIFLTDIRQYLIDNSFMNNQFAFAWKDSDHNNVIKPFINFISQVDWTNSSYQHSRQ